MNSVSRFMLTLTVVLVYSKIVEVNSFTPVPDTVASRMNPTKKLIGSSSSSSRLYNTGGWGIGPQREMVPEEFATRSDNKRVFDGYKIRDRGEFMRQVKADQARIQSEELQELLGVAQIAGIQVKDPKERLNKFEEDVITSSSANDDDDDLDLSITWDDDNNNSNSSRDNSNNNSIDTTTTKKSSTSFDDSITRLDEDTGALGVW